MTPYRIQFLDELADVVQESEADAMTDAAAIELSLDLEWPPGAVAVRILDPSGREVRSESKERR